MRALILALAVVGVVAAPDSVRAQTAPAQAPPAKTPPTQTPPAKTPPATTPPAQTPAAQPPATPATPAAEEMPVRSLFEPTWQQFEVGGRFSSVSGDPARWQRYEDLGSGLLFTNARYQHEWEQSGQLFQATADNVGWRDQRFTGLLERPGRFRIAGSWDQIPQFYSVDTSTPFTGDGAILTLDDATQRAIQNGQANLNAYVPQAVRFDMRERRDTGIATAKITPTENLDLSTTFRTQKHVGELPWGASFGFSNDVEVALPYTSRTNDISLGAEWNNSRNMFRVAYDGSWFNNEDDTLVWDSPLRLDPTAYDPAEAESIPGRGQMSLWPTNQSQTVSAGGFTKLARRTQVTGFVSFGAWSNESTLQPFTNNSALPVLALPRQTTDADAQVFSTNLSLVSRPVDEWRFSSRLRVYDFENQTPAAVIPEFVSYDTSISTTHSGGPHFLSHNRTTFTADATWTGMSYLALAAGYTRNHNGYDFRVYEAANEDVLSLTADALGLPWGTIRASLEFGDRTGTGLDEQSLVDIGEQPGMRHYDIANRQRRKFSAQVELFPSEAWSATVTAGFGNDDYDESYFGLQESAFRVAGFGVDYQHPSGIGVGGSYNYERYTGFHTSRSASPGEQAADPLRDWTTDSTESVHYFSLYVTPPRIGRATEARFSYDYSNARARYVYGLMPGSPLTPPSQLPVAYNRLQELRGEVRHRLSRNLAATASYTYEPFKVYDFAMDPSVINGIVQPSSLVLGYVYRPYTAHSAIVGILYFW